MNIFEKIKDFFTPTILVTKVIEVPAFTLYVMDNRKIKDMRKIGAGLSTIDRGLADIENRKIYVEYDWKGIYPDDETLGHEVKHLIYGLWHK